MKKFLVLFLLLGSLISASPSFAWNDWNCYHYGRCGYRSGYGYGYNNVRNNGANSFLGGMLGGMLGGIIGNSINRPQPQPQQPPIIIQQQPQPQHGCNFVQDPYDPTVYRRYCY